jgi:hypothetical protein
MAIASLSSKPKRREFLSLFQANRQAFRGTPSASLEKADSGVAFGACHVGGYGKIKSMH